MLLYLGNRSTIPATVADPHPSPPKKKKKHEVLWWLFNHRRTGCNGKLIGWIVHRVDAAHQAASLKLPTSTLYAVEIDLYKQIDLYLKLFQMYPLPKVFGAYKLEVNPLAHVAS